MAEPGFGWIGGERLVQGQARAESSKLDEDGSGIAIAEKDPKTNCLLAGLAAEDYDALMTQAKVVPLKFRKRLLRQDERIEVVYFPITSMVSLLVTTNDEPHMEM